MKSKDFSAAGGKKTVPENIRFFSSVQEKLKEILLAPRFEHSQGVAYLSSALAMCHGIDHEKARLAGLLHDCGKGYSGEKLLNLCKEAGISLSSEEQLIPHVWHAIYGPHLAKTKFGIKDPEILSAIRWHTTGRAHMSLLERIVYLADYIEPGRYKSSLLPTIRKLAFSDLDRAVLYTVKDTLGFLKKKNLSIDTSTMSCYSWLKEKFDGE